MNKALVLLILIFSTTNSAYCMQTTSCFDNIKSSGSSYTKVRNSSGQVTEKYRCKNNKVYTYSSYGSMTGYYRQSGSQVKYYAR